MLGLPQHCTLYFQLLSTYVNSRYVNLALYCYQQLTTLLRMLIQTSWKDKQNNVIHKPSVETITLKVSVLLG